MCCRGLSSDRPLGRDIFKTRSFRCIVYDNDNDDGDGSGDNICPMCSDNVGSLGGVVVVVVGERKKTHCQL